MEKMVMIHTKLLLWIIICSVRISSQDILNLCDLNPCLNNGTCAPTSDGDYTCNCSAGYVGKRCSTMDYCVTHDDGELCKGGACIYRMDSEYRDCMCFLNHYWDHHQKKCREIEPPCLPNPCRNEGLCTIINETSYNCTCGVKYTGLNCEKNSCKNGDLNLCKYGNCSIHNETNTEYCECNSGYVHDLSTELCEIPGPCTPNPCKHNGECFASNTTNENFTCVCTKGFTGPKCDIFNNCPNDGCAEGKCVYRNNTNLQFCECEEEYTVDTLTMACRKNEPPCFPNPCAHRGLCIPESDTKFNCSCLEGYVGETCEFINYCEIGGLSIYCANNNASCAQIRFGFFFCDCGENRTFSFGSSKCEDLNLCPYEECPVHEKCIAREQECVCRKWYERNNKTQECEYIPHPCPINICLNDGICTRIDVHETTCDCPTGYIGNRCQIRDKCTKNKDGELCKYGACTYNKNRDSRSCTCFPGTYWDDYGKMCREPELPCFPNPCQNGGSCGALKYLDIISHYCKCSFGYEGENCEIKNSCINENNSDLCPNGHCVLDESRNIKYCQCLDNYFYNSSSGSCDAPHAPCFPNPCENNGKCFVITDDNFNCTCMEGFMGSKCDIINNCSTDGCGNGECVAQNDTQTQYCKCEDGYMIDELTKNCRKIDECFPNPCENNGTCTDYFYPSCSCVKGFTGDTCSMEDLCELKSGNTFCKNSTCVMDYEQNVYFCDCENEDKYFDYFQRQCTDLDMCPLMTCGKHEVCTKSICTCKMGFKRNKETGLCEPTFCDSLGCPVKNMLCTENVDDNPYNFQCGCPNGFSFNGKTCVPAFCLFPSLNNCQQKCIPTNEGYKCECFANYTLKEDNHTCALEVEKNCGILKCEHGTCANEGKEETCLCAPGYLKRNQTCVDICTDGSFPSDICPNDNCVLSKDIGFRCLCVGKYEQSENGVTCTIRKICSENQPGWSECKNLNAICEEKFENPLGYVCTCPEDTITDANGHCTNPCEITEYVAICSRLGAICDPNTNEDFKCRCPGGFTSLQEGERCNILAKNSALINLPLDIEKYKSDFISSKNSKMLRSVPITTLDNAKIQNDVTESMMSLFPDFQRANVIKCKIIEDYVLCKIEVQLEASDVSFMNRTFSSSAVCKYNESISKQNCLMPPTLVLRRDKVIESVSISRTSICDNDLKKTLCSEETECLNLNDEINFICSCKRGYKASKKIFPSSDAKSYIEICKDINECKDLEFPCPKFMKCINTIGSYKCQCLKGYIPKGNFSGSYDSECVELCSPNPCAHGECSKTGPHTYQCNCGAGYRGELCNFQDKFYKGAKANTAVVGGVLGGILLITIILYIATVTRLRQKKHYEEPQVLYSTEMSGRSSIRIGTSNSAYE